MTRDSKVALRLFVSFALLYLGTAKGILEEVDDVAMLRVTESIVRSGSVAVAPDTPGSSQGVGGRHFTRYGLGQSLLGIPLYILGSALPAEVETDNIYDPHGFVLATPLAFVVTGVGALSTAATVALLFLSARALQYSAFASAAAATCLGLGTFAWFYARTFMSEAPSMLFALLATYGLLRYSGAAVSTASNNWLLISGCGAGLLLLMRFGNAALLPPLGIWLLWILLRRNNPLNLPGLSSALSVRSTLYSVLAWVAPVAAALLILAAYNQLRFGSPFDTGYADAAQAFSTPLLVGLYGLLLSPGKSLFLYAPVALAGVVGWATLRRSCAALAWTVAAMAIGYTVFYARFDWWYGGGPWGPRFLTVILPFFGLGIAALLSRPLPRLTFFAIAVLALASFGIQLVSILVPYLPYDAMMEQDPFSFDRMLWHPAYSPLVVSTRDLLRGTYPPDLAFSYFAVLWLAWLQAAATLAGAATLIASLRPVILRAPRPPSR